MSVLTDEYKDALDAMRKIADMSSNVDTVAVVTAIYAQTHALLSEQIKHRQVLEEISRKLGS